MNDTSVSKLQKLLVHLDGAYAPNTLRAYKADMLEFIEYCNQTNNSALPAMPNTVGSFLMHTMGYGIKSSTIRRKISSISAVHRLTSLEDPTKHPDVKIIQRKISFIRNGF
jgi:site-specific recombinase XerD